MRADAELTCGPDPLTARELVELYEEHAEHELIRGRYDEGSWIWHRLQGMSILGARKAAEAKCARRSEAHEREKIREVEIEAWHNYWGSTELGSEGGESKLPTWRSASRCPRAGSGHPRTCRG